MMKSHIVQVLMGMQKMMELNKDALPKTDKNVLGLMEKEIKREVMKNFALKLNRQKSQSSVHMKMAKWKIMATALIPQNFVAPMKENQRAVMTVGKLEKLSE